MRRNTSFTARYIMKLGSLFLGFTKRMEESIGPIMGKRSDFRRRKQDRYFTPPEAVVPLVPHLMDVQWYIEPCAGEGHLTDLLGELPFGPKLFSRHDIEADARTTNYDNWLNFDRPVSHFITNPPWTRELLHPIIENLSDQLPTWLLFDAPWMHTKQAIPYLKRCRKIVSVGRISWMQNGTSSLDDCCWYLFDKNFTGQTEFYSKQER